MISFDTVASGCIYCDSRFTSVLRCRYRVKWDIFNRGYCHADIETPVSRLRVFINRWTGCQVIFNRAVYDYFIRLNF